MSVLEQKFTSAVDSMPVVAIIRGVKADEVVEISNAIYEAGVSVIEVPLNTPNAMECISRLSASLKDTCFVGCGTLVDESLVPDLVRAGAELAVTPSVRPNVIADCVSAGLLPMPGFITPTEAFAAIGSGAKHLKLFPASTVGPVHVKAIKAVLPPDISVYAVGGVKLGELAQWRDVGVRGFGFGSEIFSPGVTAEEVYRRTQNVVQRVGEVYAG